MNTIMNQAGQKRVYSFKNARNVMELAELENKAHLFYKLAVVKDRKYRFRTYRSTFVGKEIVDSMVVSGLAESRKEAVELGRAIAENFDLFENCDNSILNRAICFEDESNKFYRFSFGALKVIGKMNERETNEDEKSIPTTSSESTSTTSGYDRPSRGSGLRRQNGTRNLEQYNFLIESNVAGVKKFNKNKWLGSKMSSSINLSRISMCAIFEEDAKDELPGESSRLNTAKSVVQNLTDEESDLENEAIQCELSEVEKVELKNHKIRKNTHGALSVIKSISSEEDGASSTVLRDTLSQKSQSDHCRAKYGSLIYKINANSSSVCQDNYHNFETQNEDIIEKVEKNGGDRQLLPSDEFDTKNGTVFFPTETTVLAKNRESTRTIQLSTKKIVKKTTHPNQQILKGDNVPTKSVGLEPAGEPLNEEKSEEQEMFPFITSPQELPTGLRRHTSDATENFDDLDIILKKKGGNLLTMGNDDDRSLWTEFIIRDENGRDQYRKNEIKRRSASYSSCVKKPSIDNDENNFVGFTDIDRGRLSDEETINDKKSIISDWQPSVTAAPASKKFDSDQSYMDFTVLDNTVALSYVEEDENYVLAEPSTEEDDGSLFHIYANSTFTSDDDDMTQITMDHALMRQSTKNLGDVSIYPSVSIAWEAENCSSTSKKRIQEIFWHDLYSCEFSVVQLAIEELRRIVASEPKNRKQIVRMGGVMAIMGAMEKYFELEAIQYYCCVIIELLLSMEPDAHKVFNEIKGIQLIARSMQDQANSDRVQEAGRAALETVCRLNRSSLCL